MVVTTLKSPNYDLAPGDALFRELRLLVRFHFRVIWIQAITIFTFWRFAITIHLIGNLPLQLLNSLIIAIMDVSGALGPTYK